MRMLMGYARVSTDAQSLEAQMAALKAAGCERLYAEKRSGAETDRKALAKLMKEASPGDTAVVTRLDCLARCSRRAFSVECDQPFDGSVRRRMDPKGALLQAGAAPR
jgi:DNA invertase Pin-like site-specific DNA recombinase